MRADDNALRCGLGKAGDEVGKGRLSATGDRGLFELLPLGFPTAGSEGGKDVLAGLFERRGAAGTWAELDLGADVGEGFFAGEFFPQIGGDCDGGERGLRLCRLRFVAARGKPARSENGEPADGKYHDAIPPVARAV